MSKVTGLAARTPKVQPMHALRVVRAVCQQFYNFVQKEVRL